MIPRALGFFAACMTVAGCASTQLNYNTVDLAGSIDSVYQRQILNNVGKLVEDRWAIPSYLEIASGTFQTSNSVTPSVTFPVSDTLARTGAGLLTGSTRAGAGATLAANDSWQQNWVVAPVTDAGTLRLIRAIYRYVIFGLIEPQYHFAVTSLYRGPTEWLYWRGGRTPSRLPPEGVPTVSLGMYGGYELIVTTEAYSKGYVQDLILAVMAANDAAIPAAGKGGKKANAGNAAAPSTKRNRFQLIVPNAIIPAQ